MPELGQWMMWKERCALGLCTPEVKSELQAFAYARFRHYAQSCIHLTNTTDAAAATPSAREAWHRFETTARIRNTRGGKAYKDWLFARAGSPPDFDAVQGGASLIMRDVVREFLRHEFSPAMMLPLDAPVAGSGSPGSALLDLLPDRTDDDPVTARELARLADDAARSAFAAMKHRERVAMLARELGISLAHPDATGAAGCAKSQLSAAYHTALRTLAAETDRSCPREDRSFRATAAIRALDQLKEQTIAWGRSEKRCAQLFSISSGNRCGRWTQ